MSNESELKLISLLWVCYYISLCTLFFSHLHDIFYHIMSYMLKLWFIYLMNQIILLNILKIDNDHDYKYFRNILKIGNDHDYKYFRLYCVD